MNFFKKVLTQTLVIGLLGSATLHSLSSRAESDEVLRKQLSDLTLLKQRVQSAKKMAGNQVLVEGASLFAVAGGAGVAVVAVGRHVAGGLVSAAPPLTAATVTMTGLGVGTAMAGAYVGVKNGGKLIATTQQILKLSKEIELKRIQIQRQLASSQSASEDQRNLAESELSH